MSFVIPPYVPIRNDTGIKSLSTLEHDFIQSCATASIRTDGRTRTQLRSQRIELQRNPLNAVATVQWGTGTRVACTCSGSIVPPRNNNNQGQVIISVLLSTSASTSYRQAAPVVASNTNMALSNQQQRHSNPDDEQKLTSNRLLRTLERLLDTVLDAEALIITPETWVWQLTLQVVVIDAGGNLLDATVQAAMAALRHYRLPQLESGATAQEIPVISSAEPTPLPLHHTPLSMTFGIISVTNNNATKSVALADPDYREELVSNGLLTIALNKHGQLCLFDFTGGCELSLDLLNDCRQVAARDIPKILCTDLEKTLADADEKFRNERLHQLQQRDVNSDSTSSAIKPLEQVSVPFYETSETLEDLMQVDTSDNADNDVSKAQLAAEEAYRQQALDYNFGHKANKVREDKAAASSKSSALLGLLMKSAETTTTTTNIANVPPPPDPFLESKEKNEKSLPLQNNKAVQPSKAIDNKDDLPSKSDTAMDDDEEEAPMQFTSEFANVSKPANGKDNDEGTDTKSPQASLPNDKADKEDDDDDVDLMAAIKKKKKKKGKK